jgi:hypothetical protein
MPTPLDQVLYASVKREADAKYAKPSAYKSGYIVKRYKDRGGMYSGKQEMTGLTRWYKEHWADVGNKGYPVYRPTKRINKSTPITVSEIDPKNLREQIALKQVIKGDSNLPPFKRKGFV